MSRPRDGRADDRRRWDRVGVGSRGWVGRLSRCCGRGRSGRAGGLGGGGRDRFQAHPCFPGNQTHAGRQLKVGDCDGGFQTVGQAGCTCGCASTGVTACFCQSDKAQLKIAPVTAVQVEYASAGSGVALVARTTQTLTFQGDSSCSVGEDRDLARQQRAIDHRQRRRAGGQQAPAGVIDFGAAGHADQCSQHKQRQGGFFHAHILGADRLPKKVK